MATEINSATDNLKQQELEQARQDNMSGWAGFKNWWTETMPTWLGGREKIKSKSQEERKELDNEIKQDNLKKTKEDFGKTTEKIEVSTKKLTPSLEVQEFMNIEGAKSKIIFNDPDLNDFREILPSSMSAENVFIWEGVPLSSNSENGKLICYVKDGFVQFKNFHLQINENKSVNIVSEKQFANFLKYGGFNSKCIVDNFEESKKTWKEIKDCKCDTPIILENTDKPTETVPENKEKPVETVPENKENYCLEVETLCALYPQCLRKRNENSSEYFFTNLITKMEYSGIFKDGKFSGEYKQGCFESKYELDEKEFVYLLDETVKFCENYEETPDEEIKQEIENCTKTEVKQTEEKPVKTPVAVQEIREKFPEFIEKPENLPPNVFILQVPTLNKQEVKYENGCFCGKAESYTGKCDYTLPTDEFEKYLERCTKHLETLQEDQERIVDYIDENRDEIDERLDEIMGLLEDKSQRPTVEEVSNSDYLLENIDCEDCDVYEMKELELVEDLENIDNIDDLYKDLSEIKLDDIDDETLSSLENNLEEAKERRKIHMKKFNGLEKVAILLLTPFPLGLPVILVGRLLRKIKAEKARRKALGLERKDFKKIKKLEKISRKFKGEFLRPAKNEELTDDMVEGLAKEKKDFRRFKRMKKIEAKQEKSDFKKEYSGGSFRKKKRTNKRMFKHEENIKRQQAKQDIKLAKVKNKKNSID